MSQKEVFEIKCSDCGKTEMVPFYPVRGKPFYCRACFSKYRARGSESVWMDSHPDPKQVWARRGDSWQGRKKREPTSVFQQH